MLNVKDVDITDFYFNGRWLSDFNGVVASREGVNPFSVLPSKKIKTEKVLGKDGELVASVSYEPRTFVVPIVLKDISRIREVASWLSCKDEQDFYFRNDDVKIKAMVDSAINLTAYMWQGTAEIKFIAFNPYFELINENEYVFTNFTSNILIDNLGNIESYPLLAVTGQGDISLNINDDQTININNVTERIYIDCFNYSVYNSYGDNCIEKVSNFITLKPYVNSIKVFGNCSELRVLCRSRWI